MRDGCRAEAPATKSDLCALLWRQGHRTKRQGQYIPNGREAISPTTNSQFPAARQGHTWLAPGAQCPVPPRGAQVCSQPTCGIWILTMNEIRFWNHKFLADFFEKRSLTRIGLSSFVFVARAPHAHTRSSMYRSPVCARAPARARSLPAALRGHPRKI